LASALLSPDTVVAETVVAEQESSAQSAFLDAEAAYVDGRLDRSLDRYLDALRALLADTVPVAKRRDAMPEVELALRRVAELAGQTGRSDDAAKVFAMWSLPHDGVDPLVTALARNSAGWSVLRATGDRAMAERIWGPLGDLEEWRFVGPFDNERGSGFDTAYGPEKGIDLGASYEGKVRSVSWRELPEKPRAGFVDLDAMLRPNDESLAYAVTFILSEKEQLLALRLGTDEGFRAWLNGALIGQEDRQRTRRFDQSALALPLRKGWNCLLLKISEEKDSWGFRARLTHLDGSPSGGWSEGTPGAADLEKLKTLAAADEPLDLDADISRGNIATLEARVAASASDSRVHYLLGAILARRGAHDVSEHPDSESLRRAIEIDDKPAIYHLILARSYRIQSRIGAERDDNDWRGALEAAVERGSALASLRLGSYYRSTFGNLSRARQHFEKALERNPDCTAAVLALGSIDAARGFPGAQRRALRRVQALAPNSRETRSAEAGDLASHGLPAEHRRALEALLARDHLDTSARWSLISAYIEQGRRDAARKLLEDYDALTPFSNGAEERLASMELGEDRPQEAAKRLAAALVLSPEDHELLERLGRVHWELDDRVNALASWESSIELQPNQPELRERLELLHAQKEGFDDEFRRDAAAIAKAAHAETYDNKAGNPARFLLDLAAVEVNRDGTSREYTQQIVQVLNDVGVRSWDSFATSYAAGEQIVKFNHADGTSEEARLPRFGARAGGRLWRRASVDLPTIVAGDVVEVAFVREEIEQSFFGDYFGRRELFRGSLPIQEKVFTLRVPSERKFYFHQRLIDSEPLREEDEDKEQITYTWSAYDVPKLDVEPAMPPEKEILPLVEISTFDSWDAFNDWYWNLIKRQFESSPEIDKKVAELVSGKDTELEKIRALYNFVVTDVRYNAWEFGVHGFKPYNASKVFARRFGDCKDKATLLSVMMDKVGIEAHPVLISAENSRGKEDLTLPLIHHFNHCITYVPASGGRPELYLDGTATFHSVEELPSMDRGADVLIVRETGALRRQIPWNEAKDLSLDEEWDVHLKSDNSADVTVRLKAKGGFAVALRRAFEIEAQRRETLGKIFGARYAGAEVIEQSFSDLTDLDQPVSMTVKFHAPKFAAPSPQGLTLSIPDDFYRSARALSSIGALETRETDIILSNPRRSSMRVEFRLPAGAKVKSTPQTRDLETRFGQLKVSVDSKTPESVVVEVLVALTAPRVPRTDYESFRELTTSIDLAAKEQVVLEN
jgi:transglutaminase-like putative cysteine protease/tetratricopeptide (TPR) repeat protein